MTTAQLKETPLANEHRKLSARMVDFAGWNMPVQYKSIVTEHQAVPHQSRTLRRFPHGGIHCHR